MKTVSKSASKLVFAAALVAAGTRADSLWPAAGQTSQASMFADRKANATGDILTIVVSESVAAANTQSTNSSRSSSISDAIQSFFFPGLASHKGSMPALTMSGNSSSTGGGSATNTQSLIARAAVLVTDVLPNGNLVIEGVRVVTFSGETQYVVLHGLVRRDDIAPDNSVQSTNIADARIEFLADGAITDAQKRGWLVSVYEKLRPL